MNGLVGYASSDSEDENSKPEAKQDPHVQQFAKDTATKNQGPPKTLSDVTIGPVIGPIIPNGQTEDGSEGAITVMSEREAIRFLTQAPYPMTSMPPSPPGSPDPTANAKFARFRELKAKGVHFNLNLASKPGFLNPGLLPTLLSRAGIDERDQYNTVLPLDIWNPKGFPDWAYKEELLESQKAVKESQEREKKALSAAGKRKIDFTASQGDSGGSSGKVNL